MYARSKIRMSLHLYMFSNALVGEGDSTTRDKLNIEGSGLVTGQGDVPTGYRKEFVELNMLRLLQKQKCS